MQASAHGSPKRNFDRYFGVVVVFCSGLNQGFPGKKSARGVRLALLPFHLSSGIIRVWFDLAGLFRNKDIRLVLMIRLARRGARKQPHYRIVVIEKERARNGRPVEVVGTYNPRTNPASVELKRERVVYWVSKGAQMSDRVNKLFSKPAPVPASAA